MKFSAVLACTMAFGAYAHPAPIREPSGRLALRSVVRADDVVERDTLSLMQRGHITRLQPESRETREAYRAS